MCHVTIINIILTYRRIRVIFVTFINTVYLESTMSHFVVGNPIIAGGLIMMARTAVFGLVACLMTAVALHIVAVTALSVRMTGFVTVPRPWLYVHNVPGIYIMVIFRGFPLVVFMVWVSFQTRVSFMPGRVGWTTCVVTSPGLQVMVVVLTSALRFVSTVHCPISLSRSWAIFRGMPSVMPCSLLGSWVRASVGRFRGMMRTLPPSRGAGSDLCVLCVLCFTCLMAVALRTGTQLCWDLATRADSCVGWQR